jgi:hypothetical protein
MLTQNIAKTVCSILIVGTLCGCVQSEAEIQRQQQVIARLDADQALIAVSRPTIMRVEGEFVTASLTIENGTDLEICIKDPGAQASWSHRSEELTGGSRQTIAQPATARLQPGDKVAITITAELFDTYVYGDGMVQWYDDPPRYRDLLQGGPFDPDWPLGPEALDNIYGKQIRMTYSFTGFVCDVTRRAVILQSPTTSSFVVTYLPKP